VQQEGSTRFALDDGETLIVGGGDVGRLYELLWRDAHKSGAISLAALIHEASFQSESIRATIELTAPQSTSLREAMAELYLES
jgi:hypothetical protein